MKHCPISFAEFGWIWADSVALYTSQFILLMSNEPFLSLSLSILSSSNHSSQGWSKDLFFRSVVALLDVFWLNLIWHSCSLSVTSDLHLVVKGLVAVFTVMNKSHSCTPIFSSVLLTLNRCCEIVFLNSLNNSEYEIIQFRCFLWFLRT